MAWPSPMTHWLRYDGEVSLATLYEVHDLPLTSQVWKHGRKDWVHTFTRTTARRIHKHKHVPSWSWWALTFNSKNDQMVSAVTRDVKYFAWWRSELMRKPGTNALAQGQTSALYQNQNTNRPIQILIVVLVQLNWILFRLVDHWLIEFDDQFI